MKKSSRDTFPAPSAYDDQNQPLYALDDLIEHWQLTQKELQLLMEYNLIPMERLVMPSNIQKSSIH